MSKKPSSVDKFKFGIDFQELILNFLISDRNGYKAIELIEDSYFGLVSHGIIFRALKTFWKNKKRIPSKELLNEKIRLLYESREFAKLVIEEDKQDISRIVDTLYSKTPKDGDEILTSIISFARYINVKAHIENQDIEDFDKYGDFLNSLQKSIQIGNELDDDLGTFLVAGAKDRINKRALGFEVTPLPWRQLNRTLNAGGVEKGSLIMIMAEQKRFKTGIAINWGRQEMKKRRRGFYVDFENGELAIATRGDQGILTATKREVLEGKLDEKMMRTYRKYKRIGSELVIKRFPAYKTSTKTIQAWLDRIRLQHGIIFDYGIVDYGDLGAATSGRVEDDKRISDFYIDLKNLAIDNNLDYILTLSHVKRDKDTIKRKSTVYLSSDVAKAIDKCRHCDMILGLQENDEEKEAGVMRLEVVDQRDGCQGRVLLKVDISKQLATEFSVSQEEEYYAQLGYDKSGNKPKAEKNNDV